MLFGFISGQSMNAYLTLYKNGYTLVKQPVNWNIPAGDSQITYSIYDLYVSLLETGGQPILFLLKNKFDISEPISGTFENASQLDLVVIPLVAFDNEGFRLGMGKGYYDFTFGTSKINRKPLFWGLSYDFQKADSCYPEDHDLKMEAVICPSGVKKFT